MQLIMQTEKECLVCGEKFTPKNNQAKYCSPLCKGRAANAKKILPIITKKCLNCGKEFISRNAGKTQKYCRVTCSRNDYKKNNKDRINILSNISRNKRYIEDPAYKYNNIKRSTFYRKLFFNISYECFLENFWNKPCHYCGNNSVGGIDRVENGIGYEPDNCVPCCKKCNLMKQAHGLADFFSHIKQIYKHSKLNKN